VSRICYDLDFLVIINKNLQLRIKNKNLIFTPLCVHFIPQNGSRVPVMWNRKIKSLQMLTGSYMEASPEYRKYVQDPLSSGEITYIGVPIHEKLVFITQNGGVYSRNAFSQDEQQSEVFNILKTLAGIDAISIK
jgi:hypothetical protein